MRRLARCFLLIALSCCQSSHASDSEGAPLIIATYNVRNYLSMDRIAAGKWRPDYPKPEAEKSVVRKTIQAISPDILTLQEMGSMGHLEELRRDLKNEGLAYESMALLEADDGDRRIAALWKGPIDVDIIEHANLSINYFGERVPVKRGLLELAVRSDALRMEFSLFIAHLKSKYTDNRQDPLSVRRRTLEARAIRDRILERFPNPAASRFLIAGDLNDTLDTSPLRAFYKRGDRSISIPIECKDQHGLSWTHYYKKQDVYSRVDYMLRSPGFSELAKAQGIIENRDDFYLGSDHRMVWIRVETFGKDESR